MTDITAYVFHSKEAFKGDTDVYSEFELGCLTYGKVVQCVGSKDACYSH